MEIWKPVITHNLQNYYEVSNLGNVRSLPRQGKANYGTRFYGGKPVKPFLNSNGYLVVNLTYKGFRKQCTVHTLVLESFVSPKPQGLEACHNDGNPSNAKLENLRWDTRKNNHADKKIHGTQQIGSKNPFSKINEEQAFFIKYSKKPLKELAKKFNVSIGCIEKIRYNETWKHI
jgi:hypothetical protein